MIKFETLETAGWRPAIRGMRNPKNSWDLSDTKNCNGCDKDCSILKWDNVPCIGPNDHRLMTTLRNAGTDHRKYMRMMIVYVDITAPFYWWKEFDTYKVGTVANSCSTMHKIADKGFELDDFSHEHLDEGSMLRLKDTLYKLNFSRKAFLETGEKEHWWQMIQLLPSSYNQKRTVKTNYEMLANAYHSRKHHKLDEWSKGFCEWCESLPYSELITSPTTEEMLRDDIKALKAHIDDLLEENTKLKEILQKVGIVDVPDKDADDHKWDEFFNKEWD